MFSAWVLLPLIAITSLSASQPPQTPVSMELLTEPGFAIDGQRPWIDVLKSVGITSVRIRSARPDEEPSVANRGTEDQPRYAVVGMLSSDNRLHLPGLTVKMGDRQKLSDWLSRLSGGGEDAITGDPGAFGLTAKQFLQLHEAVKPAFRQSTKGQPVRSVVQQIVADLPVKVDMDATVEKLLSEGEPVSDELQGLSRATVLAAAVRPLGLVVLVTGQGQRVGGLRLAQPQDQQESWPVGIAPTGSPNKSAPTLFKFVNVEINEEPLSSALEAIAGRIKIPILFDHNALALQDIDLNKKVSLPAKKTFYKKILDDLLFQAKLRSELRVDDRDEPFLWITTIKK
jgi:hypothetical protein